jgi:hypothetical protein
MACVGSAVAVAVTNKKQGRQCRGGCISLIKFSPSTHSRDETRRQRKLRTWASCSSHTSCAGPAGRACLPFPWALL